ncbi:MAG TPA: response regulator [Candidatus Omnitrophica bacterium]|nr:response regulator [Candidatus Omnitrophota bacterium]
MSKKVPKVLIVDDEEGIRESLKLILGDHYDIILTDSGEQALRVLEADPSIALVLMDIKMPKVDGLDVLKAMKAKRPNLNVVMVTGYKAVETAGEAARLGASGYIIKPFKSDEILNTVKRNLA